ncbi:MAG: nonstructural protein [Microvirus sp.]|nr:MAG: nonstructural protein [Microvirus sp.]
MRTLIFTVYDNAVKAYLQPFFCRSKGEAVRSFTDACNDEKSQFNKYAADYVLFFLGEFDDAEGLFYPIGNGGPTRVISAQEVMFDSVFPAEKRSPGVTLR